MRADEARALAVVGATRAMERTKERILETIGSLARGGCRDFSEWTSKAEGDQLGSYFEQLGYRVELTHHDRRGWRLSIVW